MEERAPTKLPESRFDRLLNTPGIAVALLFLVGVLPPVIGVIGLFVYPMIEMTTGDRCWEVMDHPDICRNIP